jgi:WD40 repeat protein
MLSIKSLYRITLVMTLIIAGTVVHSTAMDRKRPAPELDGKEPKDKRLKTDKPASQTEGSQASVPLSLGESQRDTIEVKTAKQPTNETRRKILYDTLNTLPLELINMIIAYTQTTITEYNEHKASIKALTLLNGGTHLATASLDGTIRILNLQPIYREEDPRCECSIQSHKEYYNCLAALQTPHGELLANNIPATCISIFNPDNKGECVSTIQTKEHPHEVEITLAQPPESQQVDEGPRCSTITSLVPWGQGILLIGFADDTLEIWNIKNPKRPIYIRRNYADPNRGFSSFVKLDATHLAAWKNSTLRIWEFADVETKDGRPSRNRKIEVDQDIKRTCYSEVSLDITCIAPLAGHKLVCGCTHGYVCLYDWQTGELLRHMNPADEEITAIAAQDEQRIVFGTEHGAIRVWNPVRAKFATIKEFFAHPVTTLLVTPKEGWIIAGFRNGTVMVFV